MLLMEGTESLLSTIDKLQEQIKQLEDTNFRNENALGVLMRDLGAKDQIINSLKEENKRWKKQAAALRKRVVKLEYATGSHEIDEEYPKDDNGSHVAENHFDQREHYREM